jgi:hypothetical protein
MALAPYHFHKLRPWKLTITKSENFEIWFFCRNSGRYIESGLKCNLVKCSGAFRGACMFETDAVIANVSVLCRFHVKFVCCVDFNVLCHSSSRHKALFNIWGTFLFNLFFYLMRKRAPEITEKSPTTLVQIDCIQRPNHLFGIIDFDVVYFQLY